MELCDRHSLSVIQRFCLWAGWITYERVSRCPPNMVVMRRGDPLEVAQFWCWSESICRSMIAFPLTSTLRNRALYDVFSLNRGRHHHHTMQQCWRSRAHLVTVATLMWWCWWLWNCAAAAGRRSLPTLVAESADVGWLRYWMGRNSLFEPYTPAC